MELNILKNISNERKAEFYNELIVEIERKHNVGFIKILIDIISVLPTLYSLYLKLQEQIKKVKNENTKQI
jgi:hypothetical protein